MKCIHVLLICGAYVCHGYRRLAKRAETTPDTNTKMHVEIKGKESGAVLNPPRSLALMLAMSGGSAAAFSSVGIFPAKRAPTRTLPPSMGIGSAFERILPPLVKKFFEKPTQDMVRKNAAIFAITGLLPLGGKEYLSLSITGGFAACLWLLYSRGKAGGPTSREEEMEEKMREMQQGISSAARDAKTVPQMRALGITMIASVLGVFTGSLLASYIKASKYIMQELAISLCTSFVWFLTASNFKVQDVPVGR